MVYQVKILFIKSWFSSLRKQVWFYFGVKMSNNLLTVTKLYATPCWFPMPFFFPQTSPCPSPEYFSIGLSQHLGESEQGSWLFWVLRKITTTTTTTTNTPTTSAVEMRCCFSRHLLCEVCLRYVPICNFSVWLHWVLLKREKLSFYYFRIDWVTQIDVVEVWEFVLICGWKKYVFISIIFGGKCY